MPTYRIADLVVRMDCGGRTAKQAAPYRIEDSDSPDVEISVTPEEIETARVLNPELSDDEWEYILSATAFYRALIPYGGLMLHASAILYHEKAYLFSAPSGTGKSTHTKLWQKAFGSDQVRILNDDKPAIRRVKDRFLAYGTPWSGKYDISIPVGVELAGICFLSRAEDNSIRRLSSREALSNILSQTLRKLGDKDMDLLFAVLTPLLRLVPIYQLDCNISTDAARLAERTMNREADEAPVCPDENKLYRVQDGYTLIVRAGSNIISCLDDDRFIGVTTLNSSGVVLFRLIENGAALRDLSDALIREYGIPPEQARIDAENFLKKLLKYRIIKAKE